MASIDYLETEGHGTLREELLVVPMAHMSVGLRTLFVPVGSRAVSAWPGEANAGGLVETAWVLLECPPLPHELEERQYWFVGHWLG